jgi:NAD(P)-dependent dehydrogenase (short-subunit alcohol dehydrogenase family)
MFNPLDLSNKPILVTGASSGIGRATAIVLSKLGAKLILTGRRVEELQKTRALLDNYSIHTISPFDLLNLDEIVPWLTGLTKEAEVRLSGVVHAAGVSSNNTVRSLSKKSLDRVFLPNLYSTLMLLRAASSKGVVDELGCSFVIVSSTAALVGEPGMVPYSASKSALTLVAKSAAKELAAKRIRVNCVAPGYVNTPMFQAAAEVLPGEKMRAMLDQHLLGLLEPEEVAVAIAYLLSDYAARVTGTSLVIDSGYSS